MSNTQPHKIIMLGNEQFLLVPHDDGYLLKPLVHKGEL